MIIDDQWGDFYLFPGDGQEKGEDLHNTLRGECLEEIGCDVLVGDIVCIREYIGADHEFAKLDKDIHQVEFYFSCQLFANSQPRNGHNPDDMQIGVEWHPIHSLKDLRLYPKALGDKLSETSG